MMGTAVVSMPDGELRSGGLMSSHFEEDKWIRFCCVSNRQACYVSLVGLRAHVKWDARVRSFYLGRGSMSRSKKQRDGT